MDLLQYGNLYINSKLFNKFRELLAGYVSVDVENVFPTLGGDGALRTIFYELTYPNDSVVILNPTYSMVNVFTSLRGLKKLTVDLYECSDWWCVDFNELLSSVRKSYLVVVDDPNNPTGSPILKGSIKLVSELAEVVGGFLVIDETYYEFSGYTVVPLIKDYPNIIVVRSLSKAFSLAGFRLGYIVGSSEVIKALSKGYTPFDIPLPSLAVGIAALEDNSYVKVVVDSVKRSRELLTNGLRKLGFKVYNSLTNFVLVRSDVNIRELLLRYGIAIKSLGNNLYRVSVGSEEQCIKLLEVLGGVL